MRVLIVDDHPLTSQGLAALLMSTGTGLQVECVNSAAQARARLQGMLGTQGSINPTAPDWIFLDIQLPDDPQRRLLDELCHSPWAAKSILISAVANQQVIRRALACGMRGFIPKSADPALVLAGFAAVQQGTVFMPQRLALQIRELDANARSHTGSHAGGHAAGPAGADKALSPRLADVLQHVLRGSPNKVIARDTGLSEHTVKEYISSILAHFDVRNRLELVLKLQGLQASQPLG